MAPTDAQIPPSNVDLLIVGGGIYGAWTAFLAARAGVNTLLVEKDDWGSGTSSWSSKLIHGGLRYLEYGDIRLVRKALVERRMLSRMAPHWIWPLRFQVPVWDEHRYKPWQMSVGLTLYDLLAGRGQPVKRHTRHSAEELLGAHDFLNAEGLHAGFSYGDCGTDDARLVWTLVHSARMSGAKAMKRVEAVSPLLEDRQCVGALLRDTTNGTEHEVRAKQVIYTCGPWIPGISNQLDLPGVRLTKGVHLVMPACPGPEKHAFLLTAKSDRRVLFLIPWYGRTLLGTTDTDYEGEPAEAAVSQEDQDYLLQVANERCPGLNWTEADIVGRYAGVRTLQKNETDDPGAVSREWEVDEPVPGCRISVGGKLTSARAEAAVMVKETLRRLSRHPEQSDWATAELPLVMSEPEQAEFLKTEGVEPDLLRHWIQRYGARAPDVLQLARETGGFDRVEDGLQFREVELEFARRFEDADREEDVTRRRVPVDLFRQPGG